MAADVEEDGQAEGAFMERVAAYRAAPGCCVSCGSGDPSKPIVDTNAKDPGIVLRVARVYLCGDCVMDAARQVATDMGQQIVSKDAYGELVEERNRLLADNLDLITRTDRAEAIVEALQQHVPRQSA